MVAIPEFAPTWDREDRGAVTIVRFRPRLILGLELVRSISAGLFELVDSQARHRLVLDFSAVELFDSLFMATIFQIVKKLRDVQGRLAVAGLSPAASEIFASLPVFYAEILQFHTSPDEAIAWCEAPSELTA